MTSEQESFDELSAAQNRAAQQGSDAVSSVAKHAQRAMDSAKDFVAGANLGSVEIQDSSLGLFMIQALNGAIRSD